MGFGTNFELRVRGGDVYPGDYLHPYKATVLHVYNDLGTIRVKLSRPSPNGNDNVSFPADRTFPITRTVHIEDFDGDES